MRKKILKIFGLKVAEWTEKSETDIVNELSKPKWTGKVEGAVLIYTPEQEKADKEKEILKKMEGK